MRDARGRSGARTAEEHGRQLRVQIEIPSALRAQALTPLLPRHRQTCRVTSAQPRRPAPLLVLATERNLSRSLGMYEWGQTGSC